MHTSTKLTSSDFTYRSSVHSGNVGLEGLLPGYRATDRLAVVCGPVEDAVRQCGAALLAATTGFYDDLRANCGPQGSFFNYPAHFALIDVDEGGGINTAQGRISQGELSLGTGWGNLDVWPESQWIRSLGSATDMLGCVYRLHINRLFWPAALVPQAGEAEVLPVHAQHLLKARLRSVHLFGDPDPNIEVICSAAVDDLVAASLRRLPGSTRASEPPAADAAYREEPVSVFLRRMACAFASEHAPTN